MLFNCEPPELNLEACLINSHVFARSGQNFGGRMISAALPFPTEGRGFSAGFSAMVVCDNLTRLFVGFQVPVVVQFGLLFARPMILIAPLAPIFSRYIYRATP
jgi:hypothetical protein